ncbi:MAG: M14 family metallopeptidase, partial [Chitinophagaceae bacterium]
QIVAYCQSVAQARPDMVKMERYGVTNEGRGLDLIYIALPQNLLKLDEIRTNNLKLAGLTNDNSSATTNMPATVWLSYNVHGNEPASSEAAMLTLHALVDPNNTTTKKSLENLVVIIDPCLNPDGRDRYVNWYNSVVGKQFNADPSTREHMEPWPQGRSNHYNFDLNRDWAWQTQIESKQRIKKYLEWMPQIHVDYHEQGYNEPYYFAPAAEPLHEVITPWQRSLQTEIGKNNAKAFDGNHWLYFTKERFDLFYPSYGDTYPTYNGAVGMTYEQGGIRGGLGIVNEDGDTLTLVDRANHHFTTGLATIETAALNSKKLLEEFKKFFDDSRAAKNFTYKSYIITSDNEAKIKQLRSLLQSNGIQFGQLTTATPLKGFYYQTQKEETVNLKKFHLAVSLLQPRSVMANVLLEPASKLTDSNTYDITAWSLPFAYGLDAYALKEAITVKSSIEGVMPTVLPTSAYGYVIKYQSLNAAKTLAHLLKNNIKVRYAQKPFKINQQQFDAGTLIVLNDAKNKNLLPVLNEAHRLFPVEVMPVSGGFVEAGADFGSPDVRFIPKPNVAILTGDQVSSLDAGECWNFFDQVIDYPASLINAAYLNRVNLKNYQVLIMPDGFYRVLNDKSVSDKLKEFVRNGGKIIAIQSAVATLSSLGFGIKAKEDKEDDKKKEDYADLKKFGNRERDYLSSSIPGAIYKVELDNSHPLAFGYPNFYYTLKQDANVYEFMKDGWNVGFIKKDNYITGFSGAKVKSKLKDGLLFGVEEMGRGSVIYLADNPLFRMFWHNGHLLFNNAVFIVGQ